MQDPENAEALVDHFFRREYGRIVSILTKSFGVRSLDLVEDSVQAAMMRALSAWRAKGIPDDANAWLYRTARNIAIDTLRRSRFEATDLAEIDIETTLDSLSHNSDEAISDETLRLLFLTCHPEVPLESSIAMALKLVSGFGTTEIAAALLISHANAEKRITRGKEKLRTIGREVADVDESMFQERIEAVQATLYLIFSEGFASSSGPSSLRIDLCEEAIRLSRLLIEQCPVEVESSAALLAIMMFHSARLDARVDTHDAIVLLEDQDRSRWNWSMIREGMHWMQRSAKGSDLSRYHIEAAIAWEHCRAESFAMIDWGQVCNLYEALSHHFPGPMVQLNHAIAVGYCRGQAEALQHLSSIPGNERVKLRPWWDCAIANVYRLLGKNDLAIGHFQDALRLATNQQQRDSIARRIEALRRTAGGT